MKKTNHLLLLLLPVIVLVVIFYPLDETGILKFLFKPLIMLWVSAYFLVNLTDRGHPLVKPALFAFFFSWIGDIVLMFRGTPCFLMGLGAFLISHIVYIYLFQKTDDCLSPPLLRKNPWWIGPFIAYGSTLLWFLLPRTSNIIKPAIILYAITILAMATFALNRRGRVPIASFQSVMAGALLFVTSDSLIAINKFSTKIPHSGFWVMSTYILAQILIMNGLLIQINYRSKTLEKIERQPK